MPNYIKVSERGSPNLPLTIIDSDRILAIEDLGEYRCIRFSMKEYDCIEVNNTVEELEKFLGISIAIENNGMHEDLLTIAPNRRCNFYE